MAADWTVALRRRLQDAPGVQAAVGANIYWAARPQGRQVPDIILTAIPGFPGATFSGDQELVESRVQFDCWARDRKTARAAALAAIAAVTPPAVVDLGADGQVRFDRSFCEEPSDGPEATETGLLHRARFDAMVWHAPADGA